MISSISKLKIWKDMRGQDLIEYALIAGFIALSYAAISPRISSAVTTVFTKVNRSLIQAASTT